MAAWLSEVLLKLAQPNLQLLQHKNQFALIWILEILGNLGVSSVWNYIVEQERYFLTSFLII